MLSTPPAFVLSQDQTLHEYCVLGEPLALVLIAFEFSVSILERKTGLGPATPTLARWCSTAELLPRLFRHRTSGLSHLSMIHLLHCSVFREHPAALAASSFILLFSCPFVNSFFPKSEFFSARPFFQRSLGMASCSASPTVAALRNFTALFSFHYQVKQDIF